MDLQDWITARAGKNLSDYRMDCRGLYRAMHVRRHTARDDSCSRRQRESWVAAKPDRG